MLENARNESKATMSKSEGKDENAELNDSGFLFVKEPFIFYKVFKFYVKLNTKSIRIFLVYNYK